MAQGAGLELSGLVMKAGSIAHNGTKRHSVTLEAQEIHFAALEQTRIGRTVRNVTADAAFCALRRMLKDKWPGFLSVAFQADGITRGGGAKLRPQDSAVLVVTIGAGEQFFIHAMMKGLGKFGGNFLMASVTELRLRLAQNKFRSYGMVGGVAVNAAHVAGLMR